MEYSVVDDLLPGKAVDNSLSANDVNRLHDVLQRYARCSEIAKTRFLQRLLTTDDNPLLLYLTKTIFDGQSTKVVSHIANESDLTFNMLPINDRDRSMDMETLKQTMDNDFEWICGLSEQGWLTVFVKLMLSSGTNIMTTIVKYVDDLIVEKRPSLQKFIGKYSGIRNRMNAATRKSSAAAAFTNGSSDDERILVKSNLDKYRVADSARQDYAERTDEWKNKLDSFYQKYRTEPGGSRSALKAPLFYGRAPKLPVWTGVPFGRQELLPADDCRTKINGLTMSNGNDECRVPTTTPAEAVYADYEQARRFIDEHVKTVTSECGQFEYVPVKNDEMFSTINLSDDPYIEKELLKKLYWTDGFVAELVAMVPQIFSEGAHNHRTFPQPKATL